MPTAAGKQNRTLEILLTAKDQTRSTLRRVKQEMLGTVRTIRSGFATATRAAGAFHRQIFNLRNALVLGAGAAMTKFAADFEDQLMQVRGLIDDPNFSLQPFSRGVRDIAIETGDSFSSLNKSLFDTISAGVDAGSALEVLGSAAKLAAAGGTDTATAVDGLTSLLNAYGLEATEATRITDALFQAQKKGKTTIAELSRNVGQVAPLAATLGVSIEEVTGALAALTTAGLSTEEAATQVKSFFTAIIKPGAEAKRAAAELGLEFDASAVSGGRFLDFIKQLEEATGGSTEQLARMFPNVRSLQGVLGLALKQASLDEFLGWTGRYSPVPVSVSRRDSGGSGRGSEGEESRGLVVRGGPGRPYPGFGASLKRELAPSPGRGKMCAARGSTTAAAA